MQERCYKVVFRNKGHYDEVRFCNYTDPTDGDFLVLVASAISNKIHADFETSDISPIYLFEIKEK